MIDNGEGTRETILEPGSPDSSTPDGGDASPSQYSSCGESEFERYCSANSVMGTPNVCSSSFGPSFNDYTESDFGSLKSLDNFSLGAKRFHFGLDGDRNLEDQKLLNLGIDCLKGAFEENGSSGFGIGGESSGIGNELDIGQGSVNWGLGDGDLHRVGNGENAGYLIGLDVEVGLSFDGREGERGEDGGSSICGYSEDDSMYRCGSDEEHMCRKDLNVGRKVLHGEEGKVEDKNPLIMSSSVAFGSEDWDGFELESGGGVGASLTLDKYPQQGLQTEAILLHSTSLPSSMSAVAGGTEIQKDVLEEHTGIRHNVGEMFGEKSNSGSEVPFGLQNSVVHEVEAVRDIPIASYQVQGAHELAKDDKCTLNISSGFPGYYEPQKEDFRDVSFNCIQVQGANDSTELLTNCPISDVLEIGQKPLVEKNQAGSGLNFSGHHTEGLNQTGKSEDVICINSNKASKKKDNLHYELETEPLADRSNQLCSYPDECSENAGAEFPEDPSLNSTLSMLKYDMKVPTEKTPGSVDFYDDHTAVVKAENFELIEFYDEIVNEMEEILLDSGESPGARFPQGNRINSQSPPLRDGGSTASTSGIDDARPLITQPQRIDGVEVVGAKQKRGDVSLGERLVGVKEYTVYTIRVWSGKDQWEVERRYRDFYTLYRRLKSLFAEQGWTLPSPWSLVEKESRKIFGNASPCVVSERSILIQECLCSTIHSGFFSSPPSALVWFLGPQDLFSSSSAGRTPVPWSIFSNRGADAGNFSTLGKTVSLIVEIRPHKITKQMLEAQHYTCAGCHKHFDDGITVMQDFVQTLGWGKPRLCEYTGQLFCSSCHANETAVLPARVLHHWDFTHYPVSQLAKSYLDSIHEQPMLCVSAVNPSLFSKVPSLHHILGVRKRIGVMLPYVRCPFCKTINKGLGSRRYLLESNDFFSLRDLIDLSKGAFAALPVIVETVSRTILEHITEQCLVCCDVGVPCSARQACSDPSSLIFPFQEGEIERCTSCKSVFHKPCFKKVINCSCGALVGADEMIGTTNKLTRGAIGLMSGGRSSSRLPLGLLSGLFTKANPENMKDHRDNDNIILMGSLPSTSL